MKYKLTFLLLWIFGCSFGQQITYEQFKEDAKTNVNLQPEYGHVQKSDGMKQEDNDLVKLALKTDTTPRKASEHFVRLGFSYLSKGDFETAMKRFNQAWLLDPKNENVYWGYGAVYGSFGDYPSADIQLDKGLSINPKSSVILTDKGTLLFVQFQHDQDQTKLNKALDLLKESYGIDPQNVNTAYKLSICCFLNNDCGNAWKYYDACQKLGGGPIAANYTEALKSRCPK